jgi:hypothetical protein
VWWNYNDTSSRLGIPFHFLLRDILQFDLDVADAIMRIENAARTCSIFIGLGDSSGTFTAFEYSYEEVVRFIIFRSLFSAANFVLGRLFGERRISQCTATTRSLRT